MYDLLPSFSVRADLGIEISHQDLHIVTGNFIHNTLHAVVRRNRFSRNPPLYPYKKYSIELYKKNSIHFYKSPIELWDMVSIELYRTHSINLYRNLL